MWKCAAIVASVICSTACLADEGSPNQGLLGDWGGLRTRLYQQGVDLQLGYTTEAAYNLDGGDKHLLRNADQFTVGTTLDLDKLLGVPKAKFQITLTQRDGNNLSDDAHLQTLTEVQEIYGRGKVARWTQFSYDQVFFNDALDIKLGRLTVGEDFMSFSCLFENLSFCGSLPGNVVSNWYNWPVSQWAARVKVNFGTQVYAQVGAYQINPSYLNTDNAIKLNNPDGTIGTLIPVEVGWTPNLFAAQLPGAYRVGVWYDSANQPGISSAPSGTAIMEGSESGFYLMAQQQVTGTHGDARGLSLFANLVQADRDTAFVDQLITVGLFYTGPFDARPQDDLGFAVGRTHVNHKVADAESAQAGVSVQHSEYPIEVYYSFNLTRWLTLRPNLQYIVHPGGTGDNTDVVVAGLKATVKF
jgi:porin